MPAHDANASSSGKALRTDVRTNVPTDEVETSQVEVASGDAREPEPDHRRGPAKLNREQALAVMKAHLASIRRGESKDTT